MKKFVKFAILVVALIVFVIGCAACSGGNHPTNNAAPVAVQQSAPAIPTPVAVQQPPSAAQVASQLNCTGFVDNGPAPLAGVVDSGHCSIGAIKYAIDTFMAQSIRNTWLKTAEQLGVNPAWETATSVTYKSVTS